MTVLADGFRLSVFDKTRHSFGGQSMRTKLLGMAAWGTALLFLSAPVKAQQGGIAGLRYLSAAFNPSKSNKLQPRTAYKEGNPGVFRKFGHYVNTHKELLLMDSLVVLPVSAEAASTVHCLHVSPFCNESNGFLGRRPSTGAVWGLAIGFSAMVVTANHVGYSALNNPETWPRWRHVPFTWDVLTAIKSSYAVKHNIDFAEKLQSEARMHVMRKD
jgi:hypothetical protein